MRESALHIFDPLRVSAFQKYMMDAPDQELLPLKRGIISGGRIDVIWVSSLNSSNSPDLRFHDFVFPTAFLMKLSVVSGDDEKFGKTAQ